MLETSLFDEFDEFYGGKSYETKTGSTFDSLQEVEETDQEQAQLTLLERIDRIVKIHSFIHKKCKDKDEKAKAQEILDKKLAVCSGILEINNIQMLLLSFVLNFNNIRIENLAAILQVTRIQCLNYLDDLDVLLKND